MTPTTLTRVPVVCLMFVLSLAGQNLSAQTALQAAAASGKDKPKSTVYNPYPAGILPTDVESEIARVLREIDVIENRAIAAWHSMPKPALTGQPPTLQGTGYQQSKYSVS